MRICTLMENTAYQPQFTAEHGLSLYIETGAHKLLFDTGATGAFADNAALLGVDLSQVDLAVLSHGHYDHGGGLARFLACNSHAPVYLSRHAFGRCYNKTGKYIGLDPALAQSGRLVLTGERTELGDGLLLLSCNGRPLPYPLDSAGQTREEDGQRTPDQFLHEQYLVVQEGEKRVVFSGCSHKGVLNIVTWLEPDVLIGGFHYMHRGPVSQADPVLDQAAQVLLDSGAKYYTCHCTGTQPYAYLKERMGDALSYLAAGQEIEI